jgi:hypothetical protein
MLGKVFEDLLQTLGLVDRQDPMTEMVAKKLVELATSGIREPRPPKGAHSSGIHSATATTNSATAALDPLLGLVELALS